VDFFGSSVITMSKTYSAYDVQKHKLEKLMSNIDKPVHIPESKRERQFPDAPEFVRNIMGSSAGAGSGEFHVYRHLRRKEYARQKFISEQAVKEDRDKDFKARLEQNKRKAEEKTERKRLKRLKKKQKRKNIKKTKTSDGNKTDEDDDSEDEEEKPGDNSKQSDPELSASTDKVDYNEAVVDVKECLETERKSP
jgi:hypothetical protein